MRTTKLTFANKLFERRMNEACRAMREAYRKRKMLRLMVENVRRYRAGTTSHAVCYARATKLWTMAIHNGWDKMLDKPYMEALGFA